MAACLRLGAGEGAGVAAVETLAGNKTVMRSFIEYLLVCQAEPGQARYLIFLVALCV